MRSCERYKPCIAYVFSNVLGRGKGRLVVNSDRERINQWDVYKSMNSSERS